MGMGEGVDVLGTSIIKRCTNVLFTSILFTVADIRLMGVVKELSRERETDRDRDRDRDIFNTQG